MDHNEHTLYRQLDKELADKAKLGLREAIVHHTGSCPGANFFQGLQPIDGLWVSDDLDISNACVMPFGFGIGNHRAFILDLPVEALVGESPVRIIRPAGQRLNSRVPGCSETYIKSLECNIKNHRLIERLHDAHTRLHSSSKWARKVIMIDEEGKAYMRHAEKVCRKLKCCRIAFSPEAALWIRRVQVYHSLLRFHQGKIKNRGNLKRAARRYNIPNPFQLSLQDIARQLQACKQECMFYQEHGKRFQRKHIESWKKIAEENEDKEAFSRICAIIQREHQQDIWRKRYREETDVEHHNNTRSRSIRRDHGA